MPRATDETFLNKLSQKQKDHPNYSDRLKSRTAFQITHYAGNVQYVFTITFIRGAVTQSTITQVQFKLLI